MEPLVTSRAPRTLDPQIVVQVVTHLEQGWPADRVVALMRSLGLNKIESARLLRRYAHLSLGQAKDLVDFSPAWDDKRMEDESFQDSAERALRRSGTNAA